MAVHRGRKEPVMTLATIGLVCIGIGVCVGSLEEIAETGHLEIAASSLAFAGVGCVMIFVASLGGA